MACKSSYTSRESEFTFFSPTTLYFLFPVVLQIDFPFFVFIRIQLCRTALYLVAFSWATLLGMLPLGSISQAVHSIQPSCLVKSFHQIPTSQYSYHLIFYLPVLLPSILVQQYVSKDVCNFLMRNLYISFEKMKYNIMLCHIVGIEIIYMFLLVFGG